MNKKLLKNTEVELKLFDQIEKNKDHSQRSISKELNIALGLSNALLKRFVSKGFLKLSQAPMKRYFYYITPKGLVEKTKLTSEFLKSSLQFYNKIRNQYEKEFNKIKRNRYTKIILVGISEFTEIAILAAKLTDIKINFIVDENFKKRKFCEVPVRSQIDQYLNDKQNTLFVISSQNGISNFMKKLLKKKNVIKPNFLLLD
tara:strand:- start:37303 stop:37905 length:603 start_codon:yes stop_codon:yes gene_type:complete